MLERMIEMAKVKRSVCLGLFIDMEKAYDKVNRKKLFERLWSTRKVGGCHREDI